MSPTDNQTVYLSDYRPPFYQVETVDLTFDLDWEKTLVTCVQHLKRHPEHPTASKLFLDGEDIKLVSVAVNGKILKETDYNLSERGLELYSLPEELTLTVVTEINPRANKTLSGLYQSGQILCTQNEAEGFRRITFFQDRPDVMAKYTTKIIASQDVFPILLSNGNKIDEGKLGNGKHWALWEDPFKKPCYLYALVAGDLGVIRDHFITKSNRRIALEIYCDHGSESRCHHAMESLKKSMKWDEERFGLEYDLDLYMIVAVDSFNAGAMENKGLNIFNSSLTLADAQTATDANFLAIEGVIGHEYFHNWTGNRVTCRDWFQLTLKEGLTVFRDQLFSEDMNSYTEERLGQVASLRAGQFPEDSGPMSHPIKPKSYISIDNFYSATVYNKGAEVIRMVHTLLGEKGFRRGMNKYFELFDGQAVTTEDFLHAMSVANDDFDLNHFSLWYHQAGTPEVKASWKYDQKASQFILTLSQFTPATSGQFEKKPLLIPIKLGLINSKGQDIPLTLKEEIEAQPLLDRGIILLSKEEQKFTFEKVTENLVPSLNRDFSSPIRLQAEYSRDELLFLMSHDQNDFNRCEAVLEYGAIVLKEIIASLQKGEKVIIDEKYLSAFGKIIDDSTLDPAVKASCMAFPMMTMVMADQAVMDFGNTIVAYDLLHEAIASRFEDRLLALYKSLPFEKEYLITPHSVAIRSLRSRVLWYLKYSASSEVNALFKEQFETANNMTDKFNALRVLADRDCPERLQVLKAFYDQYRDNGLVVQKWLSVQASSSLSDCLSRIRELEKDPVFDRTIPNMVRSLYNIFGGNSRFFHAVDGSGYRFIADKILELDSINPHVSSGLARLYRNYKKLPSGLQNLMKEQLERILKLEGLSKNTFEIISRTLA